MSLIPYFRAWMDRVVRDDRLRPQHISLYAALLFYWNNNQFRNPLMLRRKELMRLSKIGSKDTYTKCLKELHQWNYMRYLPSANAQLRSQFHMFPFDSSTDFNALPDAEAITRSRVEADPVLIAQSPETRPGTVPVLAESSPETRNDTVPVSAGNSPETGTILKDNKDSKYNRDNITNPNIHESDNKISVRVINRPSQSQEAGYTNNHNRPQRNSGHRGAAGAGPTVSEAEAYFIAEGSTAFEGKKFFLHYQAFNWKIKDTAITNWQPLASKWIMNSATYTASRAKHPAGRLHVDNNKNFAEPL